VAGVFTGIVEEVGTLSSSVPAGPAIRLSFDAPVVCQDLHVGDSVAVNGCCLTVVERGPAWWAADAVAETLSRTGLGRLEPGDRVNLERSLRADARLGGHLVQGHVDGVGRVVAPAPGLRVRVPSELAKYVAAKGSIAVDGCSLTVVDVVGDVFGVAVIPHTAAVTTLGARVEGDGVNLEVDVVAKYVERLLLAGAPSAYLPGPLASNLADAAAGGPGSEVVRLGDRVAGSPEGRR
jgi:riboflavin synthase